MNDITPASSCINLKIRIWKTNMNTFNHSPASQAEALYQQQQTETQLTGDKNMHSHIEADAGLIASLKKCTDFQKSAFLAADDQYALLSLLAVSSYFAPCLTVQPTLKLKTGHGSNVGNVAKTVGRLCASPYFTHSLQGADINKHCLNHEYATVVTMYDLAHSKTGRNTGAEVKQGHHLIVHAATLPYKHSQHDLMGSLHLPDAVEGQAFSDAEKLSEVEEAELTVLQAELKVWEIKNKGKVLEKLVNNSLVKPDGLPDELFEVWKPVLVLASFTTAECLQAMYLLMQDNNPYKNQLQDETAELLDIKVIIEQMKLKYPKETVIASATLVGELKALPHEQWKDLHPKTLSSHMQKVGVCTEQIKYHHISTTGYKLDALQTALKDHLDMAKPLQQKRYQETQAALELQLSA